MAGGATLWESNIQKHLIKSRAVRVAFLEEMTPQLKPARGRAGILGILLVTGVWIQKGPL